MVIQPTLNPDLDIPVYRQLYEHLRGCIMHGDYARGQRLPATRDMANDLTLNRTTVITAYSLLEEDGLIVTHVGRGSFVSRDAVWEVPPPRPAPDGSSPMVSFATSRPSERLFPLPDFQETCREVTADAAILSVLQLGAPVGYGPLRQHLRKECQERQEWRDDDDVLIVNGAQQALDLMQRVLAPAGETVLVEEPVYPGLKSVFERAGARLLGVPLGTDGVRLDALKVMLAREKPRLLVVTPNFHNPTGATMPLAARRALLELATAANVTVVENDLYGALRYEGADLPTIKHFDGNGRVLLVRSFSKVAFPGLRVGWVVGPRPLIARLTEVKQTCDLHTDQLAQALLLRFAESGRLARHVERMRAAGRERLRTVLAACEKHLPAGTTFTRPEGGMNLWVRLPEPLDSVALLAAAQQAGVTYLPGRNFALSGAEQAERPGALRLSFAGLEPEAIRRGVALLGGVAAREWGRQMAGQVEPASAVV